MPIAASLLSPLRYPGSKASLVDYIEALLEENYLRDCHIVEPYAGSAIVSLELLNREVVARATIVEKDPLIFAFWYSVFHSPYSLVEKLNNLPITIETWNEFQKYRVASNPDDFDIVDMGLAGLFFNRTNFSGILKAGPIGGADQRSQYKIDCRFNKDRLMKQIINLSVLSNKITVLYEDALLFLKREKRYLSNEDCFLYIDPPYFEKGKALYRYWYTVDDHKKLANFLFKCNTPWLASYDNHQEIRSIYRKATALEEMYFDYTVSRYRKETELLISNLEIPPGVKEIYNNELA